VRATRAYLAGLGTAGTLVLAASILFVLGSAIVTYNGWPKLGGIGSPATQTLTAHPKAGTHAARGLASVKVVKPHAGTGGVSAAVANKRRTLLALAGRGTATHGTARHTTSATISHPVAGSRPTHSSAPTKTGTGGAGSGGGSGSGSGGSGSGSSGSGATTVTVPVVTTPAPVSATPTTPVSTGSGGQGGSGSGGQGGSGSGNPGTPVVKTGSGTVVVTVPSSSGSRPTGTPVISVTGSVGSSSAPTSSSSSSTTTTSSSTTTTSSSSTSTTVTISSPTSTGTRAGSGPIHR
jgi:hypothetical protein